MKRVTEPELMNDSDQVQAYARSDFSKTEEDLIEQINKWLCKQGIHFSSEILIVDLGCGPGNISERIALRWPNANVIGIDDSVEMIKEANKRKKSYGKNSSFKRLSYEKINISSIAKGKTSLINCADVVVSNSVIHHIHDIKVFFNALLNISKKEAIHFHRDLRRPDTFEVALDIQKKHLIDAPPIMIRDFMASLLAAYTSSEMENYLKVYGFNAFSVVEVQDRYLDVKGIINKT